MKELKKEFVPSTKSLHLKELGFDEPCLAFSYVKSEFGYIAHEVYLIDWLDDDSIVKNSEKDYYYARPLYSQAFKFFRDNFGLVHTVYSNASGYMWEIHYNETRGGTHICDSGENGDCEMSGMFTTYEKAELECLKKLIEMKINK